MKTIVFRIERLALSSVLISALVAAGTVPDAPIPSGTFISYIESRPFQRNLLLADIADTEDHVIYRTDPDLEREAEEEAQAEKEKEERSWRMLDNTNIFQGTVKRPPRPRQNNTNQQ